MKSNALSSSTSKIEKFIEWLKIVVLAVKAIVAFVTFIAEFLNHSVSGFILNPWLHPIIYWFLFFLIILICGILIWFYFPLRDRYTKLLKTNSEKDLYKYILNAIFVLSFVLLITVITVV